MLVMAQQTMRSPHVILWLQRTRQPPAGLSGYREFHWPRLHGVRSAPLHCPKTPRSSRL